MKLYHGLLRVFHAKPDRVLIDITSTKPFDSRDYSNEFAFTAGKGIKVNLVAIAQSPEPHTRISCS